MQFLLVVAAATAFSLLTTSNVSASEPKRVLVIHSFGSAAPPFTVESRAFETELVAKFGERVDLDEVSLDMARYADRETQEAIVDYLQKRQAKWQPDLVVPIGSPAAIFVAKNRDRLFPETPIIYTSLDRRLLPPDALNYNAAYVGQIYELPGFFEDMLQVAPATKNIVVVVGASPLERYWREAFERAAEPFAGRIKFTYYSDITFDQMLERVATLPPDSYIFFLLLLRDAAGITLNADEALQGLHKVARAPINGIFDHQMGLGIVGGRLYQSERVGRESAQVAIRILRGEAASGIPPIMVERLPPTYDWRELERFGIPKNRLPPGSEIRYRQQPAWKVYKWHIAGGIAVLIFQAALISGLLLQIAKRRRTEVERKRKDAELLHTRAQLVHMTRVSSMNELSGSLAHELNQPLTAILSNAQAAQRVIRAGGATSLKEVDEILDDIVESDKRAGEVISRLRLLVKKEKADAKPLDLVNAVREVTLLLHSEAVQRHVNLSLEAEPALPRAQGDGIQLQQVVMNLLINAFDALNELDVGQRAVAITVERDGECMIKVGVSDSGHGLPAENPDQIFDAFYTTKANGLGMGLSISRSIIVAHGGRLWAENNRLRGATFYFTVPIAPQ